MKYHPLYSEIRIVSVEIMGWKSSSPWTYLNDTFWKHIKLLWKCKPSIGNKVACGGQRQCLDND